jgi:hypothetical protein
MLPPLWRSVRGTRVCARLYQHPDGSYTGSASSHSAGSVRLPPARSLNTPELAGSAAFTKSTYPELAGSATVTKMPDFEIIAKSVYPGAVEQSKRAAAKFSWARLRG